MYHGSLVERHGLDVAVAALGKIKRPSPAPNYGLWSGDAVSPTGNEFSGAFPVARVCPHFGPKNLEQIVEAINACDVG